MPESLQQKVDRMTAGMEVTVTFGGGEPGICTGPLIQPYGGRTLTMVGRYVRFADGGFNHRITAIDMPDPECPFEMGARVLCDGDKRAWTVTGWAFIVGFGAWMVWLEDDAGIRGLSDPDLMTLVPPEPAVPSCPAILVTYPSGLQFAHTRDDNGDFGGMDWREWQAVFADHRITVQALRPTEYLQRGQ